MSIDFKQCRELLQGFEFRKLFIEQFNWGRLERQKPQSLQVEGFKSLAIAEMKRVMVYEISGAEIPGAAVRLEIHREISKRAAENLLIFLNSDRTQSLWYWVKQEDGRSYPREHVYEKHGACDLLLSRVSRLYIRPEELPSISTFGVADRLAQGLDVERVTKEFFEEFKVQYGKFLELIQAQGVSRDSEAKLYTSVLLNRLMFVYFLQEKGFLDGGKVEYLQKKLKEFQQQKSDRFYDDFLKTLFFEGFAQPDHDEDLIKKIGNIKYLNGGLFLAHEVEKSYPHMRLPNSAFEDLFKLFKRFSWNLDDTPGGNQKEINPAVLGYIFEKYINDKTNNQKENGAYYTRPEITEYLCDRTINKLILDRVNQNSARKFANITELLTNLTPPLCHKLLGDLSEDNPRNGILPSLSLLDPACGSGAFLVAAMKSLIYVYERVFGRIQFLGDDSLTRKVKDIERRHSSVNYYIKKRIISDNLYGVDIMEEATEIAKLRLFLALVSAAESVDKLEPLPNIDFNIMAGNSLIGLMRVDGESFDQVGNSAQTSLLQLGAAQDYQSILRERNLSVEDYKRHAFMLGEVHDTPQETRLLSLRQHINKINQESEAKLNELLFNEFVFRLSIKYEQAQLTGEPEKRDLTIEDIARLKPFHWGFHFNQIIENGGFDAIIANPPWEVFQTNEKEFFQKYLPSIEKKKLRIEDWENQRKEILKDIEIQKHWLQYSSLFPHQWLYFKKSDQYSNQTTIIDGKAVGKKPNLYSLFLEQCFNLLRPQGECGIVVPSGIYSDLGTKQLREMLFAETEITGLFCFENRKAIFEDVDSRFKFIILSFEKGSQTKSFPTRFMRHDVAELANFPSINDIHLNVPLIRKLSPNSLSIMEFKENIDVKISEKIAQFPLLSSVDSGWGLELYGEELNMTRSSKYFRTQATDYPVYEGEMIWQFNAHFSDPRYWIDERELNEIFKAKRVKRVSGLNKVPDDLINDYEVYRIAIRKIARNTDTRTLISTIVPRYSFVGNSLSIHFPFVHEKSQYNNLRFSGNQLILISTLLNSFVVDYNLRFRMNTNLNLFCLYQLPIPRLSSGDKYFDEIVIRAAKLICTTPEFDELAQEVGLGSHKNGVTDPEKRAEIRAELDGIVAHLYGLSEIEFSHILSTFPLVPEETKTAALHAYQNLGKPLTTSEIATLIKQGENNLVEFKSTARWNLRENKADKTMEQVILKSVAAFLNTNGGTLLIGVEDDGNILGLAADYQTLKKKDSDGFLLFISNDLLLKEFGREHANLFDIKIHELNGLEICQINIKPAPQEMYVNMTNKNGTTEECFYIRSANSALKLSTKEAVKYIKTHWK